MKIYLFGPELMSNFQFHLLVSITLPSQARDPVRTSLMYGAHIDLQINNTALCIFVSSPVKLLNLNK